jgi:hypothetical protein
LGLVLVFWWSGPPASSPVAGGLKRAKYLSVFSGHFQLEHTSDRVTAGDRLPLWPVCCGVSAAPLVSTSGVKQNLPGDKGTSPLRATTDRTPKTKGVWVPSHFCLVQRDQEPLLLLEDSECTIPLNELGAESGSRLDDHVGSTP